MEVHNINGNFRFNFSRITTVKNFSRVGKHWNIVRICDSMLCCFNYAQDSSGSGTTVQITLVSICAHRRCSNLFDADVLITGRKLVALIYLAGYRNDDLYFLWAQT